MAECLHEGEDSCMATAKRRFDARSQLTRERSGQEDLKAEHIAKQEHQKDPIDTQAVQPCRNGHGLAFRTSQASSNAYTPSAGLGVISCVQDELIVQVDHYDFRNFYLYMAQAPIRYRTITFDMKTRHYFVPRGLVPSRAAARRLKEGLGSLFVTAYDHPHLFERAELEILCCRRTRIARLHSEDHALERLMAGPIKYAIRHGRNLALSGLALQTAKDVFFDWVERYVTCIRLSEACPDDVLLLDRRDGSQGRGVSRETQRQDSKSGSSSAGNKVEVVQHHDGGALVVENGSGHTVATSQYKPRKPSRLGTTPPVCWDDDLAAIG